uniref:Eukaryotic translation initiation factor 3 subunit K n=1 Tax=Taeniopygia guttata TaxID=59729 RepID=A0A674GG56_TAEGU
MWGETPNPGGNPKSRWKPPNPGGLHPLQVHDRPGTHIWAPQMWGETPNPGRNPKSREKPQIQMETPQIQGDFTLCKCVIDQAHISGHPKSGEPPKSGSAPNSRGNPPNSMGNPKFHKDPPDLHRDPPPFLCPTPPSSNPREIKSVVSPPKSWPKPGFWELGEGGFWGSVEGGTCTPSFLPKFPLDLPKTQQEERPIRQILYLGELLETCHFQSFWQALDENMELLEGITGFEDSVRKFICHVVGITYQHIDRWLLAEMLGDLSAEGVDEQIRVDRAGAGADPDLQPGGEHQTQEHRGEDRLRQCVQHHGILSLSAPRSEPSTPTPQFQPPNPDPAQFNQ